MENQELIIEIKKHIDFLQSISKSYVSSIVELAPIFISKYDKEENIGELNKGEVDYIKFTWSLFKILFWESETVKTLNSKLVGPFFLEIEDRKQWITINLTSGENRYLKTRPFGIYFEDKNKFYFINKSLKSKLFEDPKYENSNFKKYDVFKNISSEEQADQIALLLRVSVYLKDLEIENFKTNNMVCFKVEYEKNNWFKLYSLTDYGITDPPKSFRIGENSGSMIYLLDIFKNSFSMFSQIT